MTRVLAGLAVAVGVLAAAAAAGVALIAWAVADDADQQRRWR